MNKNQQHITDAEKEQMEIAKQESDLEHGHGNGCYGQGEYL